MTDLVPPGDLPRLNDVAARDLDAIVRSSRFTSFQTVKLMFLSGSWKQLGFASFEEWAGSMPTHALPRDERKLVVIELAGLGMTQRQIAATVGIGKGTVHRELAPNGADNRGSRAVDPTGLAPNGAEPSDEVEAERLEAFAESLLTNKDKSRRALRRVRDHLERATEEMTTYANTWTSEERRVLNAHITFARRALSGTTLREVRP